MAWILYVNVYKLVERERRFIINNNDRFEEGGTDISNSRRSRRRGGAEFGWMFGRTLRKHGVWQYFSFRYGRRPSWRLLHTNWLHTERPVNKDQGWLQDPINLGSVVGLEVDLLGKKHAVGKTERNSAWWADRVARGRLDLYWQDVS